ncbi:MAG: carboxymuconolactone decarboxylase family protein [Streptosporangiales bacterium]|nr:carboxymuconolactone decarboxylase family protein [Streptosporangiales bacterium]
MHARVDALRPGDMNAEQRELYDRVLSGPRANVPRPFPLTDDEGRLRGPFNAMLFSPKLGNALQELGAAVRFQTEFTARQREIAILVVAAHERSEFEWKAHSHIGREAGLTEDDLDGIRTGAASSFEDPVEDAVLTVTREFVATGDLTDDRFAEAVRVLGLTRLYELVTLVGYYRMLADQLRVLRVTD